MVIAMVLTASAFGRIFERIRIRRELGIPQEALVVGMIASWQPVKNHQGFLAAAAMLAKQRPDVHFVAGRRVAN